MAAYDRLMMVSDDKRSFTAKARETISGGFVVCCSGTADDYVHGSGTTGGPTSLAWSDIEVCTLASAADIKSTVGLATDTVTSGLEVGVISDGIFILEAGSSGVTAGYPLQATLYGNCFHDCSTGSVAAREQPVGRALTGASAEQKFFVGKMHF